MNWYLQVLKKYTDFSGRARRKEYWMFTLFHVIFSIITMGFDNILGIAFGKSGYGPIYGLYALVLLLPGLAVAVRRLHDINKSGWMLLLGLIPLIGGIILLIFFVKDSDPAENQYGSNPKEEVSTNSESSMNYT